MQVKENMSISVIVVDDEPLAREGLRLRLEKSSEVNVIAECASGIEAVEAINSLKPELLFLDIQMPEMNGFEVVKNLTLDPMPVIIFVTAYDAYAIKAFECHALDYILKPINEERFRQALRYAVDSINHRNLENHYGKLKAVMHDYLSSGEVTAAGESTVNGEENKQYLTRLMIKSRNQISIISVPEIDWIESAGDYVYIHTNSGKHIFRETLISLEEKLDPQTFVRIHRSAIVNLEKIKQLRANEHGDYDVYLQNGTKLKLSRTYRTHFQQMIGGAL